MDKALKSIMKGLEKDIKQYGHNMDSGKMEMTDKDPERLFHLMGAMAFSKLLCMLEEMKQDGEKKGQNTMGGMMDMMGKVGSMFPQMRGGQDGNMTHIGFGADGGWHMPPQGPAGTYGHHMPMENRRGVPGSGRGNRNEMDDNYGHYEDDAEDRRHRSTRTGRFVRGENENDVSNRMEHDGAENRQGSSGASPRR